VFFLKPTDDHAPPFQVAMLTTDQRSCNVFSSSCADHRLAIMHCLFQVSMATTNYSLMGNGSSSIGDHTIHRRFFSAIMLWVAIYDRRLLREAFERALKSFKTVQK